MPWSEIDHVDASDRAPSAPTTASPPPAAVVPPTTPPVDRVFVHMTGSPDATLQQRRGSSWAVVCASPCDTWLPVEGGYGVGGEGIRNSKMFSLVGANGGRVDLDVDPASKSAFVGGIVATSVGYGVVPIGLLVMLVGVIANSSCDFSADTSCTTSSSGGGLVAAGAITAIVGAVVGTIGVVELASNVHSNVAQTASTASDAPRPSISSRLLAWREAPSAARALAPAATSVPLYTITF